MPEVNEYAAHKAWATEWFLGWSLQRCESFARRSCGRAYDPRHVPAIVVDVAMAQARQGKGMGARWLPFAWQELIKAAKGLGR